MADNTEPNRAAPVAYNFTLDGTPVEPVNDSSSPVKDEMEEIEMNPDADLSPPPMGMEIETPVTATASATGTATARATATGTATSTANARAKVLGAKKHATATGTVTAGVAATERSPITQKHKLPSDDGSSNSFERPKLLKVSADQRDKKAE